METPNTAKLNHPIPVNTEVGFDVPDGGCIGQPIVTCRCGAVIPNDEIDYSNGCNEKGEEYGELSAQCNVCKADYETSQWGEWDDKNEAIEYLKDYIEGSSR